LERVTSVGPKLESVAIMVELLPTITCPKSMLGGASDTVVWSRIGTCPLA